MAARSPEYGKLSRHQVSMRLGAWLRENATKEIGDGILILKGTKQAVAAAATNYFGVSVSTTTLSETMGEEGVRAASGRGSSSGNQYSRLHDRVELMQSVIDALVTDANTRKGRVADATDCVEVIVAVIHRLGEELGAETKGMVDRMLGPVDLALDAARGEAGS